jgi:adenine-specific DNA-methyltransferase
VVAQLRAEGAQRVLLIVPKSLIGQWQNELLTLFGIQVREQRGEFVSPGVYVVGREFAGSERGSEALGASSPFDVVIIDEAHEIFSGLHKRYGPGGVYDEASDQALMAHRVRGVLRSSPVLLLTATPMQNSLAEIWGLVQYVEPTGTLLGDLDTFRRVFCEDDDRTLVPGQEHELQRRLAIVLQRTLRRQAQEFLDRPFTQRRCRLYEYRMSDEERSLYDDVTEYLMRPSLSAFAGAQRRLLLIGFHRRMASSIAALAASLENVASRLRRVAAGRAGGDPSELLGDLEDDEMVPIAEEAAPPADADRTVVMSELALVDSFVARARALPDDAKARTFQEAIRHVMALGRDGRGSGRAVVFTESITTQEYLRTLLLAIGLGDDDITLFRGSNDHERAREAHGRWLEDVGRHLPPGSRPARDVAVRLALVHEFKSRSKILICTEAGAKGLNLQFCETIINYDLPWNPQRIEQRIGRCHRYGQSRDVTVVNFIGRDNEAQQLTFEILSQKLDLFGKVLDASDHVLHEPRTTSPELVASAVSVEVETDLQAIYSRSRSTDEVTREIAALRDKIGARRDDYEREHQRTSQIIHSRFDQDVRRVFKQLRDELPPVLIQLDRDIAELVDGYLRSRRGTYRRSNAEGRVLFEIAPGFDLGVDAGDDRRFATGDARSLVDAQSLSLSHPLVLAAIEHARAWNEGAVQFALAGDEDAELGALSGGSGVLSIARVDYGGFEPVQRLVAGAIVNGAAVDPLIAARLARLPAMDCPRLDVEWDAPLLADLVDEALFVDQQAVENAEQTHFERAVGQLERFVEDKVLVCRRQVTALEEKLRSAKTRRDEVMGASARERIEDEIGRLAEQSETLQQRIDALESRDDEVYRKWRDEYNARRYQAPTVTRLVQVTFRIAGPETKTSC